MFVLFVVHYRKMCCVQVLGVPMHSSWENPRFLSRFGSLSLCGA